VRLGLDVTALLTDGSVPAAPQTSTRSDGTATGKRY
jgi:hypothetical protein